MGKVYLVLHWSTDYWCIGAIIKTSSDNMLGQLLIKKS